MVESYCYGKKGLLKLTDKDIGTSHYELWSALNSANKFVMLDQQESPILSELNDKLSLRSALAKKENNQGASSQDKPLFAYKMTSTDYEPQIEYYRIQAVFCIKQHELKKMSDLLSKKVARMEFLAKKRKEDVEKKKGEKLILGRNSLGLKDRPAAQGHFCLGYEIQGKTFKQGVMPLYKTILKIESEQLLRYMLEFRNYVVMEGVKMSKLCPMGSKISFKIKEVSSGSHPIDEKRRKAHFKMVKIEGIK